MNNHNQNISILKGLVGTKYGDLSRLIKMNTHNSVAGFDKLLAENDIDSHEYLLIGIGFSDFTINGIGENSKVCCVALLLETEKYGHSYEDIKAQLLLNPKVDVIKKSFLMKYSELSKYIKRIDTVTLTELGKYIKEINIIKEN